MPNHVRNFIALAQAGYYDGLDFDRIYHDEAVEDPKEHFDEIAGRLPAGHRRNGRWQHWLLAVSRIAAERQDHSRGRHRRSVSLIPKRHGGHEVRHDPCKFPNLDGNFTVFGKVTRGLDVARKIFEQAVILSPQDVDNSRRPKSLEMKVTIHRREVD